MASPCEVLVDSSHEQPAQAVASAVAACAWRIEGKFSRYRDDSVITRINRAGGETVEVDEETAKLLDFADHAWRMSEGKFDVTSASCDAPGNSMAARVRQLLKTSARFCHSWAGPA